MATAAIRSEMGSRLVSAAFPPAHCWNDTGSILYRGALEHSRKGRIMLRSVIAALALLSAPAAAIAQDKQAETGQPPQRVRSVTLSSPQQKCPPSTSTDIVVCNVVEDPYRIPKTLRNTGPIAPQRQSWVNRVASDEQTAREAGGLPNTCSAVGSGGATGCSQAAARAWAAEMRAKANGQNPNDPDRSE